MKHKWLIFLCFLLVSAVVGVIWWHSMQNGVASHAESRRVLAFALSHLQGTRLAPYLSDGHIRRLAHLTEYTTLGVVLSGFSVLVSRRSHKVWVLLIGISVAAIDEYIQLFSGGRTSTWHDVVLDSIGCMVGIVLVMVIRWLKRGIGAIHK
ncbi:VanZ family protein [Megasphaera elsdenii]|uniref:VanZ family protein n=1 Tax=Megasphaera elsdenii TaxID=907 RepID=UPI00051446CC|nr:VanZ family protein [Megasphaera elsdenii]KGI89656.1 VanZ family protein [Megasphaera elsdenii]